MSLESNNYSVPNKNYRATLLSPQEKEQFQKPGWLLVLTGPSGVGKDVIMRTFQERQGIDATQIVTYASREPRPGEIDGVDYNFVTEEDFLQKVDEGFFAEHVFHRGSYKGTPSDPFKDVLTGKNVIWRIDPTRASTIDAFYNGIFVPEEAQILASRTLSVYVGVGSLQTIRHRAKNREPDKWAHNKGLFLDNLRHEWGEWQNTGPNAFDYVLMNDGTIDEAAIQLDEVISQTFS